MDRLRHRLRPLDGKGYKAYKVLEGHYRFEAFDLRIDHVQGDPFAEPSRIRLRIEPDRAAFPAHSYSDPIRRTALEDFLCRRLNSAIASVARGRRGSGRSGEIRIAGCGQQVLARDAVCAREGRIEARLGLALPAAGRRILAAEAEAMLFEELPTIARQALFYAHLDTDTLDRHLNSVEDQQQLRCWLEEAGLVAFVGDGAVLPRRSGIDDRPLVQDAIAFRAPEPLAVEVTLPHAGRIRGLGIPRGITLIVGGGFHGKSTLLQALQRGIYDQVPGDGRERVVCEPSAVKIRAEDGRAVTHVDISGFIDNLPLGRDTRDFCTDNASGSTSQAANIVEALACGARTLLIDEDTSATNFMIRDRRMQALVAPEREPITPLIDRVRDLFDQQGVSTVLVTGGSSAYFDVADRVLLMDHYRAFDVSAEAHALARPHPSPGSPPPDPTPTRRRTAGKPPLPTGERRPPKVQAFGREQLRLGELRVELERMEQLVDNSQLLAIGHLIRQWSALLQRGDSRPILDQLQELLEAATAGGLTSLSPYAPEPHGGLALPRLQELWGAVNRIRGLDIRGGTRINEEKH